MNGWQLLAQDAIVTEQPAILKRIVLLVSTDGGDVTLYDGTSTAGRKIQQFKALANQPQSIELDVPCLEGIYIDVGSNVTGCLVVFELQAEGPVAS